MSFWRTIGKYEHEVNESGYTGWYRCVNGALANGLWPEWNDKTGETRYSGTERKKQPCAVIATETPTRKKAISAQNAERQHKSTKKAFGTRPRRKSWWP
jgi:hypothetical protein